MKQPIPPVVIDGVIYAGIALLGFLSTQFNTDDAAKFISPFWLFWIKTFCGASAATLLAIKLYRSTGYAEHLRQVNGSNTDFFGRPKPVDRPAAAGAPSKP